MTTHDQFIPQLFNGANADSWFESLIIRIKFFNLMQ